jgi:hypothetical protein
VLGGAKVFVSKHFAYPDSAFLAYQKTTLILLNIKIEELNLRKNKLILNLNENYAADVDKLNDIKSKLNRGATELSRLDIRKDLIN